MRQSGGNQLARQGQKLIIGPWPHAVNRKRSLNGIDFGDHAVIPLDNYVLRFFDRSFEGS